MSATATLGATMTTAALTIAAVMLITWVASVITRDASIVDPIWPLGFVAVASSGFVRTDGDPTRRIAILALVAIWGLRLSAHLFARRRGGAGEDFRYRAMRRRWGPNFWIVSLVTVFAVQGVLMWVVSLPVQLGLRGSEPTAPILLGAGVACWLVGFGFEAIGDAQLTRFRNDPDSRSREIGRAHV